MIVAGWMKKTYDAVGVTEWPPGPELGRLSRRFATGGAVVLLIDVSSSMEGAAIASARKGGADFVREALDGDYEIAVVLWNHDVAGATEISENPKRALQLVSRARAFGGTQIEAAISRARQMLLQWRREYPSGDAVIAIFGDGDLGISDSKAARLARDLHKDRIRVLTLGLGEQSARDLAAISTAPLEELEDEESAQSPASLSNPQSAPNSAVRVTSSESLASDLASMARGLMMPRRGR